VSESEVKKEVEKLFKDIQTRKKPGKEKVVEKQTAPKMLVNQKKTDQTHMILGVRTYSAKDKRQTVMDVLAGVLGGGMSSRLFHKLREEMGACYYVHAGSSDLTDHGYFYIATGIENRRIEEVTKVLLSECSKLTKELVSSEELKKVKDYMIGRMYLALETTNALAMFYVGQEVLKGKMEFPSQIEKEIRTVTAKDIQKVAKEIFQNKNLNLAVVGNIKDEKNLKRCYYGANERARESQISHNYGQLGEGNAHHFGFCGLVYSSGLGFGDFGFYRHCFSHRAGRGVGEENVPPQTADHSWGLSHYGSSIRRTFLFPLSSSPWRSIKLY
jgi:secreted Zn-dependent insulinase-like peptidase